MLKAGALLKTRTHTSTTLNLHYFCFSGSKSCTAPASPMPSISSSNQFLPSGSGHPFPSSSAPPQAFALPGGGVIGGSSYPHLVPMPAVGEGDLLSPLRKICVYILIETKISVFFEKRSICKIMRNDQNWTIKETNNHKTFSQ